MREPLEVLHEVESIIGYDLDMATGDEIIDYLRDEPLSEDPHYLVELFSLEVRRETD